MTILTREKFVEKVENLNDDYWNRSYERRWIYIQHVVGEIAKLDFKTSLEIGTYKIPMVDTSDVMDLARGEGLKYLQDATETPWDIPDKMYDVVVAMQVFEHFKGKQRQVFDEIRRVSRQAIITIPWKWNAPKDINHHNINEEHLRKWFGGAKPTKSVEKANRLLMYFNFEDPSYKSRIRHYLGNLLGK